MRAFTSCRASNSTETNSNANKMITCTLKQVVGGAVLGVVLYHAITMGYVFYAFAKAAAGPFGTTLAVADEMSDKFPLHFVIIQHMVKLPFPNRAAQRYYESQREFFLEAARNFEVHPYWFQHNHATEDMAFREVVTERMRSMYKQFVDSGRMDYRIEKDRCAQFHFFRRNHIAHPAIQKTWYSKEQLLEDVESSAAVQDQEHWPAFFKACHLTQRSSLGTFPLANLTAFHKQKPQLVKWINDKWEYRSRDVDRPWQKEGDALTDQLTPAFILQDPMLQSNNGAAFAIDGRVAVGLVEVKVEVLWGRVYVMQMDASTIFLRNGEMEDYSTGMGAVLHRPGRDNERTAWIRDEGYLDCVITTSERVARAAHIEYVRVDVFLDRSDPGNCAVNEISLSSGYAYYGHEQYMARLWAEPLQKKLYQTYNSTAPVYDLIEDEHSSSVNYV